MSETSHTRATPLSQSLLMVLATAAAVVAAFFGSGAVGGTDMQEAVGGWLGADATPLAPASGAFRIWSVIYLGLVGYALWQLSTTARGSARQHRLRLWAILSVVLNAVWLWVVQLGWLGVSVLVMLMLLAVLVRILLLMEASPAQSRVERLLTDGTFGLYLGWICVATAANIAAWLGSLGTEGFQAWEAATVSVIAAVTALGIALGLWTNGRIAPALSLAWGLAWIVEARNQGSFESPLLVVAAGVAAGLVLVAPLAVPWIRLAKESASARRAKRARKPASASAAGDSQ
ncbi:tryptophan-rich sensory protein [Nesterenkonia muleiensis]|uniref:tryptophan-rich sensory protein n=1 Tax=Nesterenkonia muleiensis TaxID=2282648 RepID=UPI0013005C20|nr:tryptophan-rich sensory protein [Nesterenkonia muleiensis]